MKIVKDNIENFGYIPNRKVTYHKELAKGKWFTFSFDEQMGNVGTEIGRTIIWKDENERLSEGALERGLELLDLTIDDPKNNKEELLEIRKSLIDYFCSGKFDDDSNKKWDDYFYKFAYAAEVEREKRYSAKVLTPNT